MPGTSPRRSSRAKGVVPPTSDPAHGSTSSSMSSSRADRNKRSSVVQATKGASATPGSSTDGSAEQKRHTEEKRPIRNKKRNTGDNEIESTASDAEALSDAEPQKKPEDQSDEGGTIKCICRKSEYPGPPVPFEEYARSNLPKDYSYSVNYKGDIVWSEEAGGLFIACESCDEWQHGGCVGFFGFDMIPKEDYYCWRCRKDLHKIFTGAKGRRYSKFYSIVEPEASKSNRKPTTHRDVNGRPGKEAEIKSTRSNVDMKNSNRRSTMNSRSAWDEEEMFRRALEESKGVSAGDGSANGTRKGKRGRDESNEGSHPDAKRLKTNSESGSSNRQNGDDDSGNEERTSKQTIGGSRRSRTVVQTQQDSEAKKREKERERERAEAASKRKGRAERRRVDESEPPEEQQNNVASSKNTASAVKSTRAQQGGKQVQESSPNAGTSTSHKKGSRPSARKGKVGRNQYTRDRDALADARADANRASNSREGEENGDGSIRLSNGSKPSKPRHMNLNRTSMNEIRKRAAGIFEYLSSTQVAMAGERTPSNGSSPPTNASKPGLARGNSVNGASKLSNEIRGDEPEMDKEKEEGSSSKMDEATFRGLSSLEMMDVIAREIVLWQKDFGKYGEK